jgi:hypothetical protein
MLALTNVFGTLKVKRHAQSVVGFSEELGGWNN